MEKRFQVFVSSTFLDLQKERQAAQRAVLGMNHMPAGMELFPATDDSAWQLIRDVIDTSDYYIIIIGGRYGSTDENGISYTEKEYEYASKQKIPVIALLHRDPKALPRNKTDETDKLWKKVESFRKRIEKNHHCSYWSTEDDLQAKIIVSLMDAIKRHPRIGWIRSNGLASTAATQEILDLRKTIESLQKDLSDSIGQNDLNQENLSQGKDQHSIIANITLTNHSKNWGQTDRVVKISEEIPFTWDEIFSLIGPLAAEPSPENELKSEISKHLKQKYKPIAQQKYPDRDITHFVMLESEFQKIKIQFIALGLISTCQIAPKPESPISSIRGCQITPKGQRYLFNTLALRRTNDHKKSL